MDASVLDPRTSWSFTPQPLYPRGRSPHYPLDRRLGGPHSRSGRFGEVTLLGLEMRPLGRSARSWTLWEMSFLLENRVPRGGWHGIVLLCCHVAEREREREASDR
jgi:hypothetical protein